MRIFLAGAGGVIGRRLTPLLVKAGHRVTGTTRTADKVNLLRTLGADPVVVDVFDADALTRALAQSAPDAVIHQLTDLPAAPGTTGYAAGQERNVRLRTEGTRNLVAAARAAGVRRVIAQSIAFVYAPGESARTEADPLERNADGVRARTVAGVIALEDAVLALPEGIVLRYGFFYGPGTWSGEAPSRAPAVHVEAAAQACLLVLTKGKRGLYNIAEDDPGLSSEKAKRELGFDASFRAQL